MFWSKNKKHRYMYTSSDPKFTIQKWGLSGYTFHGHVILMTIYSHCSKACSITNSRNKSVCPDVTENMHEKMTHLSYDWFQDVRRMNIYNVFEVNGYFAILCRVKHDI